MSVKYILKRLCLGAIIFLICAEHIAAESSDQAVLYTNSGSVEFKAVLESGDDAGIVLDDEQLVSIQINGKVVPVDYSRPGRGDDIKRLGR